MFHILPQLRVLICSDSPYLTDESFAPLVNLTKLDCSYCPLLQRPFDTLSRLRELDCSLCASLKADSFRALRSLAMLFCAGCPLLRGNCFSAQRGSLRSLTCDGCVEVADLLLLRELTMYASGEVDCFGS